MREFEIIRRLRERACSGKSLLVGIGDDCAVLEPPAGRPLVVTTDMLIEGTHFTADDDARRVGRKALAVSISDVAAMGCRSLFAFLAVGLPADRTDDYARRLADGVFEMARAHGVVLAGGDTTESKGLLAICSTVLGTPPEGRQPILRSGAVPGQVVAVTGRLGGSGGGGHLDFTPRQEEALALARGFPVGGMIDLSDGLSSDAWHLARESGVRLRLTSARIPATAGVEEDRVLNEGEDFELLFTVSAEHGRQLEADGLLGTEVTVIGEVLPGPAAVVLVGPDGAHKDLEAGGYEHFAS